MTYEVRRDEAVTQRRARGGIVKQQTMAAMVQDRYGPASEVLTMRQVPIPEVGSGEVLVRVHSSSVNAMEWHLMNGKPYLMRPVIGMRPRKPTLGADVAGTVVAVGADVARFRSGDEVFGEIGAGAYAEYARASHEHVVRKPGGVGFDQVAVVGVAGLTALQGLRDVLGVKTGQVVLINGASGGVGTYAVQIAKVLGAEVTAVCSTRNVEQARHLGADEVVDYRQQDITRSSKRFDAIFDIAGNHRPRQCKSLLVPGGTYLLVGGPKGDWGGPLPHLVGSRLVFAIGSRKTKNFVASSRRDDLVLLGDWLANGQVRSVIEDRFPLRDIAVPLDRQGEFHARAKTLVTVEKAF